MKHLLELLVSSIFLKDFLSTGLLKSRKSQIFLPTSHKELEARQLLQFVSGKIRFVSFPFLFTVTEKNLLKVIPF